jgi:hypothetical protein
VSGYGTPFTESEALLAILSGDEEAAEALVSAMFPGERSSLAKAADTLSGLCTERCAVCDEHMDVHDARGRVATYTGGLGSGGPRVLHHRTCPLPEDGES